MLLEGLSIVVLVYVLGSILLVGARSGRTNRVASTDLVQYKSWSFFSVFFNLEGRGG